MAPAGATEAAAVSAAPAVSSDTTRPPRGGKTGKHKLIRPRGKRGGAKNRKKTSAAAQVSKTRAIAKTPTKAGREARTGAADARVGPGGSSNSTSNGTGNGTSKGQRSHTQQIAEYHTLQKRLAQAKAAAASGTSGVRGTLAVAKVEAELANADLAGYQAWSLQGQGLHNAGETSKWLVKALGPAWKAHQEEHGRRRARLLDVGALSGTAYSKYGWIDATSIDLNPQGPLVSRADFFTLAPPAGTTADPLFDVVSLSLVLNFVGDLRARGAMLLRTHQFLAPGGWVFVALPLACVANSRYLDHALFRTIAASAGFDVAAHDDSAKLTRWLLRRKPDPHAVWDGHTYKKREVRVGPAYNNFCIRLDADSAAQTQKGNIHPDNAAAAGPEHESAGQSHGPPDLKDDDDDDDASDDDDGDVGDGQEDDDEEMEDEGGSDDPVVSD